MTRPDWMDYHPPNEHEEAARQAEDYCDICERYRTLAGKETCPVCGDEV